MDRVLNIDQIPFSRYGSFLTISCLRRDRESLFFRSVRGGDFSSDLGVIFQLIPIDQDGQELEYKVKMEPHELTLETERGKIRFCIADRDTLLIEGQGAGLMLRRKGTRDSIFEMNLGIFRVNCSGPDLRYLVSRLNGLIDYHAPWENDRSAHIDLHLHPESGEKFYVMIEEFTGTCRRVAEQKEIMRSFAPYSEYVQNVAKEYEKWEVFVLQVPIEFKRGEKLASYITWSCVVPSGGCLTRTSMYMSKNWMTNIWSWDNCFNALALAKNNPELAWDQLMLFFDLQDPSGMLPDFANDKYAYYAFTKPPIHGWTLSLLLKENPKFFTLRLAEILPYLEKWTDYWFSYTDYHNTGLPSYGHGNEAGWDNSTIFAAGIPVTSPDLLAFLIVQMDVLSACARKLGLEEKAKYWRSRADKCCNTLLQQFWNGESFTVQGASEEQIGDSLILFMPLILGQRLPEKVRDKLLLGIMEENRFLTEHGLATESTASEFYKDDGYWRGPIWAPATMLLVDGLDRSGAQEQAREIALRFVKMANKSGMYENYNAKTGKGLRDSAFTWTSSVYLYLANKYSNLAVYP